jgi:hypothetical protein
MPESLFLPFDDHRAGIISNQRNPQRIPFFFLRGIVVAMLIVFGFSRTEEAIAATSYFSPSSGTVTGEMMSVDILVDTKGVAVNNAEMVVRFPNDLLEIASTSASDSVFSLWVGAPKFSNETGTLSFTAGIPTPGFIGDSGKVLSVVFRVKKGGQATLTFSSVIIRANDGYGSNVFESGAKATFDLAPEIRPVVPVAEVLSPPVFTGYSAKLLAGEALNVYGTARPESAVSIYLEKDDGGQKNVTVESDGDGRFIFSLDEPAKEGVYRLWADVSDGHGKRSAVSEKIAIVVVQKSVNRFVVMMIILSVILLFAIGYVWHSYRLAQKRLWKETLEAESSLHTAFGSLRENRNRLEMFEAARTQRKLTDEEEKIVAWLKQDLNNAEKTVEKEIEDIEEEVR